jgi:hypothetical protein
VEVWTGASSRIAAQTDWLTSHYTVTLFDESLREVPVIGLDTVVVADDDECAVARIGAFRESYLTVEC